MIELKLPGKAAGENVRNSYARVEEAERIYVSARYKLLLTTLRLVFEPPPRVLDLRLQCTLDS